MTASPLCFGWPRYEATVFSAYPKSCGVLSCHFCQHREPCATAFSSIVPRDLMLIWPQTRVGPHMTCVPEEREPIPDQGNRNTNVVEGVDTGDGLQRDGDRSGRQGCPKPVAQRGQEALQRV